MSTTVYIVGFEPDDRAWIESALGRSVDAVIHIDDVKPLLESAPHPPGQCVIACADVDAPAALKLVRALRHQGIPLPVIVLGPHTAFRTAVDIARLEATDFLERPVSVRELRAAVRRARTNER